MKKYAMVAINTKTQDDGIHVRRVLISYLFKTKNKLGITTYHGTKFLAADPYFSKKDASHKYIFKNRYYKLDNVETDLYIGVAYAIKSELFKKRKYHHVGKFVSEFEDANTKSAIRKFKNRKELK